MTMEVTFQMLLGRFHSAREALEGLRMTVIEDRSQQDDLLIVERLGDLVEELRGWLAEGLTAGMEAERAVNNPVDSYRACRSLATAHDYVIRLQHRFSSEAASPAQVHELMRLGRREGREWQAWTGSVIEGLDQCREPLHRLSEALLQCWLELSDRLASSSISVQTTNIGQQVASPAAGRRS